MFACERRLASDGSGTCQNIRLVTRALIGLANSMLSMIVYFSHPISSFPFHLEQLNLIKYSFMRKGCGCVDEKVVYTGSDGGLCGGAVWPVRAALSAASAHTPRDVNMTTLTHGLERCVPCYFSIFSCGKRSTGSATLFSLELYEYCVGQRSPIKHACVCFPWQTAEGVLPGSAWRRHGRLPSQSPSLEKTHCQRRNLSFPGRGRTGGNTYV